MKHDAQRNFYTHKAYPFTDHNDIELLHSGPALLHAFEQAIQSAHHTIHLQTYIWKEDPEGKRMAQVLQEAAKRGVRVYLLLDSFGCHSLSKEFIISLQQPGMEVVWFNRWQWIHALRFIQRMHHKALVVDDAVAIVGGCNIGAEYLGAHAWLDFALKLRGQTVGAVGLRCQKLLEQSKRQKISHHGLRQHARGELSARLSVNDFLHGQFHITRSYRQAINHASASITMFQAYFFPSKRLLRALRGAARRGVSVRLILAKQSDVAFVKWAGDYLYYYLLKGGIEVDEWIPSVLHAKIILVDDTWCSVGSYNLNHTSQMINVEMNIDVLGRSFCLQARETIQSLTCDNVHKVKLEHFGDDLRLWHRMRNYLAYVFVKMLSVFAWRLAARKQWFGH